MLDMLATVATSQALRWEDYSLGPTLLSLGPIDLRYYSLAYIVGIVFAFWHLSRMIKAPGAPMAQEHVDDLFFWCMLGVLVGGRLGYAAFYTGGDTGIPSLFTHFTPSETISWDLLRLWDGGMSFHGGLIGVVLAIAYVCWRGGLPFIRVADYVSVNVGVGMFLGRMANFNNGELWGRPAGPDAPLAMVFPGDPLGLARHPSQLYQAALEGLLVAVVMIAVFWLTRARFRPGFMVGLFTAMISAARFTVEFFREPDSQLTWLVEQSGLSMGQWLTVPLLLLGIGLVAWSLTRKPLASGAAASPRRAPGAA